MHILPKFKDKNHSVAYDYIFQTNVQVKKNCFYLPFDYSNGKIIQDLECVILGLHSCKLYIAHNTKGKRGKH